jgi:hypothetical protein
MSGLVRVPVHVPRASIRPLADGGPAAPLGEVAQPYRRITIATIVRDFILTSR